MITPLLFNFLTLALSFALGWNYWLQWAISLPSELSAAGIIVKFWMPTIDSWITSGLLLFILMAVHLFGVRGFGETEYYLSGIKVVAIVLFVIVGVSVDLGWYVFNDTYRNNL